MKYTRISLLFVLSLLLAFVACSDVDLEPISKSGDAPQKVTDVVVKPLPGGAYISYRLPDNPDLLYIQAKYTLPSGEQIMKNSSANASGIQLEGFAEETEYEVALTSVSRSGKTSAPHIFKFVPDTPPIKAVFGSLDLNADFGGIRLTWENPSAAELAILIYRKDSVGDDVNIDSYYTSSTIGEYVSRGMDTITSDFSVKIRDKWNNYSELKKKELTPLFETKIDRTKFRSLGEAYTRGTTEIALIPNIWDGNKENMTFEDLTKTAYPWHASFTISEKPILLSRMIIYQFGWPYNQHGHYYSHQNITNFEIYGSADAVPPINSDEWILLGKYEIIKPSGLPIGMGRDFMSQEDYDTARNGHIFSFPPNIEAIRHIRIRSLGAFEGTMGTFSELEFFGDPR